MKLKLLIFALLLSAFSYAQIPAGYYSAATGTGYILKTQLYNIIKGHTDNNYDGLYITYQTSDRDYFYENDGTILDMYSENPTVTDPYNFSAASTQRCGNYAKEGDCYNREHIIPQSVFNQASPMRNDAHFITPTDGKVNGVRSNYPHGTVASASSTSLNGSKLGSSGVAGYSGTVFEPIDEFKGDIARMYFYFSTRYENTVAGYPYDMFNNTSNQVFTTAFLNMLYAWHIQDPVSPREIARNNAIYARQHNRNPYIDHPEYVQTIWSSVLAVETLSQDEFKIYPNPSNGNFNIVFSDAIGNHTIEIFSILGQKVYEKNDIQSSTLSVSNLSKGMYLIKVTKDSKSSTEKIIIE